MYNCTDVNNDHLFHLSRIQNVDFENLSENQVKHVTRSEILNDPSTKSEIKKFDHDQNYFKLIKSMSNVSTDVANANLCTEISFVLKNVVKTCLLNGSFWDFFCVEESPPDGHLK